MIRKLLETLFIEVFEYYKIRDKNGNFLYLRDLIVATLNEKAWNLSRNSSRALPKLKDVGDKSAHNRRFNAHKPDVDNLTAPLRDVVQELVYLSGLK